MSGVGDQTTPPPTTASRVHVHARRVTRRSSAASAAAISPPRTSTSSDDPSPMVEEAELSASFATARHLRLDASRANRLLTSQRSGSMDGTRSVASVPPVTPGGFETDRWLGIAARSKSVAMKEHEREENDAALETALFENGMQKLRNELHLLNASSWIYSKDN